MLSQSAPKIQKHNKIPAVNTQRGSKSLSKIERARLVARKSTRQRLTYAQKLDVIDFFHAHKGYLTLEDMVKPLRERGFFTITRTTISRSVKQESWIRQYVEGDTNRLTAKQETIVYCPEVEEALLAWIHQKLNNHVRLRGDVVMEKARKLCDALNVPSDDRIGFSRGWLEAFKHRHGLHHISFHGERASVPMEQVEAERARLQPILARYEPWNTYNIDETAVYGSKPPTSGLGTSDTGGLKDNKTRITAALCSNRDGSHKLPILFIGHAAHPRCFPRTRPPRAAGYYYFNNSTAWMKSEIWNEFLNDLNEAMRRENRHILLICDNASSHDRDSLFRYSHVRVEYLSPNLTPYVQPMDAGIIQSFKSQYNKRFIQAAVRRSDEGISDIYKLNQLQVMQFATEAWSSVSTSTISNCWRHTGITPPEPTVVPSSVEPVLSAKQMLSELNLNPERTHPRVLETIQALDMDLPTEADLTIEQVVQRMYPNGVLFRNKY
ncbi:hypothetical protein FRC09_004311 [Ceratobasidium sp. 395]|nr:hypothetical protein FRC09_004311 [Ceratobasidium sp. 395]